MNTQLRFPAGLYGVTPDWDDADQLEQATRLAARGGMRALQLRHKTASPELRARLARRLADVCRALGVVFLINDDWRLAREVGADGVHLGRDDEDPAVVRKALGPDVLIGVSCYADPGRAARLIGHGVAYIAFGAMYASATKPLAPVAPLTVLREGAALCETFDIPRPAVVAIGGIGPQHAATLAQAGANAIAVVGGLFLSADIEAAARALAAPFQSAASDSR